MRIVYLHRGYFPILAGAEIMTYRVAGEMQQRGHQVCVVCRSWGDGIEYREIEGIQVIGLPVVECASTEAHLPWQPDIVHVVDAVWPEYLQLAYDLAHALDVPLAVTPASTISTWQDVAVTLEICRQADVVYVLTESERKLFESYGISSERMVIIGQGPALNGKPDAHTFRQQYNIAGPLVLFLGRKVAFKGYRQLLDAMKFVWQNLADTHFVFIGPHVDPDCQELFHMYADPRMIEISAIDEAQKYSALEASDILCLPTTADVFPLVFVEAWFCSRPIITSPFAGVEEIIQHRRDGLIVEPDPPVLARAIVFLLQHPELRMAMGKSGWLRVQNEFNWRRVTDHVEQGYNEVLVSPFA
ncbi:glycosyltransferase family 4 protein [Dictyobacter kobayashii]|uniref:Glycogen synthase n=1 Tax=Dictyobacter kobayashii TaxID=2014872 RepID=A0A402ASK6_9CHLR|nr:glycosyltransferase family 4 protein [Dictyobacter kobayashii]GCE22071.1 glycogen synthase [Dictyobacter kobayashii]